MSADTTVVIVTSDRGDGQMAYTAVVVQAAEDFREDTTNPAILHRAENLFLKRDHPWFSNLGLAKQFAALLELDNIIEYKQRLFIEITGDKLYVLTKRGQRRCNLNRQ